MIPGPGAPVALLEARSNFFAHLHEVGHLLGLPHPGEGSEPGCVAGDEMVCYAADPDSVMGLGGDFRLAQARPWLRAIALITGTRQHSWAASKHRIHPRRI